eukprot:jgi/Phyca11/505403/fgenesh2_kg.PHYCAscaffold_13_\
MCGGDNLDLAALSSTKTTPVGDDGLMSEKARSSTIPLSSMEMAQKSVASSAFMV